MHEKDLIRRLEALGVAVVELDVCRDQCAVLYEKEKVSDKNRPTFILTADKSAH